MISDGKPSRPGKPHREREHTSKEEVEKRVEICRHLMSIGWGSGEVRRTVAARFKVSEVTAQRYMGIARQRMREVIGVPREDLVAGSFAFYKMIVGNKAVGWKERIRAQERIDKLLGLDAPVQVEAKLTVREKARVDVTKLSVEELRMLAKLKDKLTSLQDTPRLPSMPSIDGQFVEEGQDGNGNGNGNGHVVDELPDDHDASDDPEFIADVGRHEVSEDDMNGEADDPDADEDGDD